MRIPNKCRKRLIYRFDISQFSADTIRQIEEGTFSETFRSHISERLDTQSAT